MSTARKSLLQLFVPICLETLLLMLAGMEDTLMLSSVSDDAVGAVGTANTYIGVFIIMFAVVSTGMIAVMTQNIGAGRPGIAYQARQLGLAFNAVLGIVMSVFLCFCSGMILDLVGIAEALREPAEIYFQIVGSFCICNALIPIFAAYLRAFGFSKQPLIATIVGNVINLILNAIFLFGLHWGVAGVAWATGISRVVNLCIVAFLSWKLVKAKQYPQRMANRQVLAQIIQVGFPSALENVIYNVAMTLVIRLLNQMDATGMNVTARSYAVQVTNFALCAGSALAQANAILTGWRIGAEEIEDCNRGTRKAALIGILIATGLEAIFALTGPWILSIFTDDPQMISLVVKLLAIDIILESGRVTNLVYGQALKTSGDAIFPVVLAVIFMFLCAVGGTYLFGIRMELGAVGAYIALTSDEVSRAIGMIIRWKSGKWRKKGLISAAK